MFEKESLHDTQLAEHAVSANLNPRQRSYLAKLWRELEAISGPVIPSSDRTQVRQGKRAMLGEQLANNYDLAMIRRIKAKQEEIQEFLQTKEIKGDEEDIRTREEIKEEELAKLEEWAINEVQVERAGLNARTWVEQKFRIEDDGTLFCTSLSIPERHQLRRLPERLEYVNGDLDLYNCFNLLSLPENLRVERSLDLTHCKSLTFLPHNLRVDGILSLRNCENLMTLPDNLKARHLIIDETPINNLPKGIEVEILELRRCNMKLFIQAVVLRIKGKVKQLEIGELSFS